MPLSGEPKTTRVVFLLSEIQFNDSLDIFFPFLDVKMILPSQDESNEKRFPRSFTLYPQYSLTSVLEISFMVKLGLAVLN